MCKCFEFFFELSVFRIFCFYFQTASSLLGVIVLVYKPFKHNLIVHGHYRTRDGPNLFCKLLLYCRHTFILFCYFINSNVCLSILRVLRSNDILGFYSRLTCKKLVKTPLTNEHIFYNNFSICRLVKAFNLIRKIRPKKVAMIMMYQYAYYFLLH